MVRHNITEDAFRFIKYRCIHCKKIIPYNKLFCNKECRNLYFEKKSKIKHGTWTNKKTHSKHRIFELSDLLNEEDLKVMVKETERNIENIDKKMEN